MEILPYDLYDKNGTQGDDWLNFVQPLYANIPVMTSVRKPRRNLRFLTLYFQIHDAYA